MGKSRNLSKGNIKAQLRKIAIPAALGFLFNTLFNVVDSFFAGRIGTDAVAGMTLSFPVFFLLIAIASGMGNGLNALSAIAIGSDDKKRYHSLFKNTMFITLVLGLIIPVIAPFLSRLLFSVQGAEPEALDYGLSYINIVMIGYVFFMVNFSLNGMLYAQGNSKPFRNFLIVATIVNIGLNPLLINGFWMIPAMETAGIALATILVQMGGTIYLFWKLMHSDDFEFKTFKACKFDIKVIRDVLEQGLPSALNNATIALGVFVINYYVMFYGGTETVAAYGIAIRIEQLALVPTVGLNVAVLSIVGQSYGAKKKERIYDAWKWGTIVGLSIMVIGIVLIVPFAPFLISMFDDTPGVVSSGSQYLRIESFAFLSYVFLNIGVSVLQGIKKPMFAFWIGLYRQLLPLGLFYLLGTVFAMGILGVWWGIVIINWTAVIITLIYVRYKVKDKTDNFNQS